MILMKEIEAGERLLDEYHKKIGKEEGAIEHTLRSFIFDETLPLNWSPLTSSFIKIKGHWYGACVICYGPTKVSCGKFTNQGYLTCMRHCEKSKNKKQSTSGASGKPPGNASESRTGGGKLAEIYKPDKPVTVGNGVGCHGEKRVKEEPNGSALGQGRPIVIPVGNNRRRDLGKGFDVRWDDSTLKTIDFDWDSCRSNGGGYLRKFYERSFRKKAGMSDRREQLGVRIQRIMYDITQMTEYLRTNKNACAYCGTENKKNNQVKLVSLEDGRLKFLTLCNKDYRHTAFAFYENVPTIKDVYKNISMAREDLRALIPNTTRRRFGNRRRNLASCSEE